MYVQQHLVGYVIRMPTAYSTLRTSAACIASTAAIPEAVAAVEASAKTCSSRLKMCDTVYNQLGYKAVPRQDRSYRNCPIVCGDTHILVNQKKLFSGL